MDNGHNDPIPFPGQNGTTHGEGENPEYKEALERFFLSGEGAFETGFGWDPRVGPIMRLEISTQHLVQLPDEEGIPPRHYVMLTPPVARMLGLELISIADRAESDAMLRHWLVEAFDPDNTVLVLPGHVQRPKGQILTPSGERLPALGFLQILNQFREAVAMGRQRVKGILPRYQPIAQAEEPVEPAEPEPGPGPGPDASNRD